MGLLAVKKGAELLKLQWEEDGRRRKRQRLREASLRGGKITKSTEKGERRI